MRIQPLLFSITISLTGTALAAGEQLANLASQTSSTPVETAVVTTAPENTGVQVRTRTLTINNRSRKSQQQFEASLEKRYPQSFAMITQLGDIDRASIYNNYKSGETMVDIRKQVIGLYANLK